MRMSESLNTVVSMLWEMRAEAAASHTATQARLTDLDKRLAVLLADMRAMMRGRPSGAGCS